LAAPEWVLDLLVLTAFLCATSFFVFLPGAIDIGGPSRDGAVLLTAGSTVVGAVVLLGVPAILQAGTGSRPAIRAIAVVLCVTGVLLPVGLTILMGLSRSRRDVWLYRPAPRWVALLLLPLLVVSATLGLGLATDADSGRYLAVPALVTAITLAAVLAVLWRRAWARPIAGAAALLMALTVVGLPLALPAFASLWRGASRVPLEVPGARNVLVPSLARNSSRAPSLFILGTALVCVGAYLAEVDPSHLGYASLGTGPAPALVTIGAVNGPEIAHGQVWRILTAGYLHAGVLHLALNLVALLIAGLYVERRYGPARTAIIYIGSLVAGNLLAAVLSSPESYTLGASGAIMGLFAAMVCAGGRFRSERDSLVLAAGVVLATLIYGVLHSGVSNAAHVGGLVAGFWLATLTGTEPAWTARVEVRESSLLEASRRDRQERMRRLQPPAVVTDPSNRLVLRMSESQRLRWWALATAFPLVLVGDVIYLATLGRPPTGAELGFAGLCLLSVVPSPVVVLQTLGRLELTAHGFRMVTPLLPSRMVLWLDVDGAGFLPAEVNFVKFVNYRLTAAAQASGSFLASATQRVRLYGMDATDQAVLMNDWKFRWSH